MSASTDPIPTGRALPVTRPALGITDLYLVAVALIWGVNYVVVKFGTTVVDPLAYNGVRVGTAAITLGIMAKLLSRAEISRRDVIALLLLGAFGNGVYQIFFIEGEAHTRAGTVALILAATPAFVALIGRALRVERVSRRAVLGISLSVLGVAFVVFGRSVTPTEGVTLLGNLLTFAGAMCWALFAVLLKPYSERVDGLQLSALTMGGGAIVLLVIGAPAMMRTAWSALPASAWGAILYGGLGALVLAYFLWSRGVRVLGPTRTSMYGNLQPVIALLTAWLALGEVPTPWQGIGAATIIAGVLLTRS
jgi:drug/metabolite transporter (DMT)-like permease